jgi:heme exporter protein B
VNVVRGALLVAGKDLRIERRSRVALQQILPFGGVVVMLLLLAVGRSFALEEANRARDGLRLSGLDGAAIFLGKAAAIAAELLLLELVLGIAVVALYDVALHGLGLLLCTAVAATIGLAATGTVYGVLATGLRARETLVPLLLLPAVVPVVLGGTRAFQAALDGAPGDGWQWVQLLVAFAVLVVAAGTAIFGPLLEEA